LVEGFSPIPTMLEISPAQKAARRMEKLHSRKGKKICD
jgi:hypothetical protein